MFYMLSVANDAFINKNYTIVDSVELLRLNFLGRNSKQSKSVFDQFFSSASLSRFMASMFDFNSDVIHILDAGAGVGSISLVLKKY